jgi:hypothetical protein
MNSLHRFVLIGEWVYFHNFPTTSANEAFAPTGARRNGLALPAWFFTTGRGRILSRNQDIHFQGPIFRSTPGRGSQDDIEEAGHAGQS